MDATVPPVKWLTIERWVILTQAIQQRRDFLIFTTANKALLRRLLREQFCGEIIAIWSALPALKYSVLAADISRSLAIMTLPR